MNPPSSRPSNSRAVRVLKNGYWDLTEEIELPDGSRRVRKQTRGAAAGPWGVDSLRREIRYLRSLPERAQADFPPVLAAWDDDSAGAPEVGYEMPFYAGHADAGALARRIVLSQAEIDTFQDALAAAVFDRLQVPVVTEESLAAHVVSVVEQAWAALENEPALRALVRAGRLELNGSVLIGPRAAFDRIKRDPGGLTELDAATAVRLHGDLFLENILWRPTEVADASNTSRLILIDPVSVAGVTCGPPAFDLVKYVSYATGELPALRSEWVEASCETPPDGGVPRCRYQVRWEDEALKPFQEFDWHTQFQRAFNRRYGLVNPRLYQLIDGYFSAAMTVNTAGKQRLARLLKAAAAFNAVLEPV